MQNRFMITGISVFLLLGVSVVSVLAGESVAALAARADWSCVQFTTIGVCRRNTPPYVGVKVRYWQPVLMVETLKRSGETGIVEYRGLVQGLSMGTDRNSSAGGSCQGDSTRLQMSEAHVFGFPFSDAFSALVEAPCEGPPDLGGSVSYLSEQDRDEWRMGRSEQSGPLATLVSKGASLCERYGPMLSGLCVGRWGALYPRTGFSVHASEVVASAMAAFRAVDVASPKPPLRRRVLSRLLFWPSVRYDRMQLISPVPRPCMSVGEDPVYWEKGTRSVDGRYVWIYWRKKECCLF